MSRRTGSADRPRSSRVPAPNPRLRTTGGPGPSTGRHANGIVLGAGALAVIALVVAAVIVLRPGTTGVPAGAADTGSTVVVGTAVGDRAPDFSLVDISGTTVTRASLQGRPAIIWFTASYCTPCQDGALAMQRVLRRLNAQAKVAVVMVFVDPSDPPAALAGWKARFGLPAWTVALAGGSVLTDYQVQYLDSKYLLDANGVIRTVDDTAVQEDSWASDLQAVLGG